MKRVWERVSRYCRGERGLALLALAWILVELATAVAQDAAGHPLAVWRGQVSLVVVVGIGLWAGLMARPRQTPAGHCPHCGDYIGGELTWPDGRGRLVCQDCWEELCERDWWTMARRLPDDPAVLRDGPGGPPQDERLGAVL